MIQPELLYRFFKRETSLEENDELLEWVSASEQNKKEMRDLHQVYWADRMEKDARSVDVDRAWGTIVRQLNHTTTKTRHLNIRWWPQVAASVLLLLAVGFGALWVNERYFENQQSAVVRVVVPKGEKSTIFLADGTEVWLNSETTLEYDAHSPRKVKLVGEAFFQVTKDASHPFMVKTSSGMEVRVLGTKFDLRSFADEPFVETTLEEGQIELLGTNKHDPLLLSPGEQAVYYPDRQSVQVKKVDPEIYSVWRNNELRINDVTFKDLIPRIERWYGVSVELAPGINTTDRFTMTIKTESFRELMQMMQLTSNFKYTINGERIIISTK